MSGSYYQEILDKLDALVKSRFIEMFGVLDLSPQLPEWKEIGSIGKVLTGSTPKTNIDAYWNGDIKWIAPAEISSDSFYITDTERKITVEGKSSCSLDLIKQGTVLLSSRAPIGKVAIAGTDMYCNQGFKNIECSPQLNNIFLYFILKNNAEYLNSLGRGATFKEISREIVESIKIPVPPIELQKQFSDFVKQVNKSKFIAKQCLEKYNQLVKSRFIEMFEHCKRIPLTKMSTIVMGQSPDSSSYNENGVGVPFHQGKTEFEDTFVTIKNYCSDPKKMAKSQDILMSVRAPVGTVNITPYDCCIGRGLSAITPIDGKCTTRFLFTALQMIEEEIAAMGTGSTFKAINKEHMSKIMIPDADYTLQKEFSSFVELVDKSKFSMKE